MAIQITGLERTFTLKKGGERITLPDPNKKFTPEEVMSFYSNQYPELTTAKVAGPTVEGDKAVYKFKNNFGDKG